MWSQVGPGRRRGSPLESLSVVYGRLGLTVLLVSLPGLGVLVFRLCGISTFILWI